MIIFTSQSSLTCVVAAFSELRALTMTSKLDSGTALCSLKQRLLTSQPAMVQERHLKGTRTIVKPGKDVSLRPARMLEKPFT